LDGAEAEKFLTFWAHIARQRSKSFDDPDQRIKDRKEDLLRRVFLGAARKERLRGPGVSPGQKEDRTAPGHKAPPLATRHD